MKPDDSRGPSPEIDDLAASARKMQEEARAASQRGEYQRASALAEEAELLAADVGEMVDALERQQDRVIMQEAVEFYAAERTPTWRRRQSRWRRLRRIGKSVGAGLGLSLPLVEC